jgi:AcrR family transcriptional regulator
VLVASLLLFNEKGEPRTTTNEIANEVDISPGNLHYHFRRKEQIVEALLDAFQADARQVLQPPHLEGVSLDDFWVFLHSLLECTAAYRFLFRDIEALADTYPRAGRVLGKFAKGLQGVFEIYLRELARGGFLNLRDSDAFLVGRNLAVIALFSERFDGLAGHVRSADDSALSVAGSILSLLKPFTSGDAAEHMLELASHYQD